MTANLYGVYNLLGKRGYPFSLPREDKAKVVDDLAVAKREKEFKVIKQKSDVIG